MKFLRILPETWVSLVIVFELDLEHGIGQRLCDHRHDLNHVFFRQTASRFCQCARSALRPVGPSIYSVKIFAPVAVTATVCSK